MFTEIKKLRTFVAIAEEQSLTKAAARLNAAQPWVSDQLKQLEDMLGMQLITRCRGKPATVTPAGAEILEIAKKLLLSCSEAADEMKACRDRTLSKLVVGVETPTLFIPERNELIARFLAQAKGTRLEIVSCSTSQLIAGLQDGQFDLILTSARRPNDDVETKPFYEAELCLAVPKGSQPQYEPARQGNLHHLRLMVLRESCHPRLAALKSQLSDEEIDWVDCPEDSFPALMHHAASSGIATLAPALPDQLAELRDSFELLPIKDRTLKVRWSLMRRRGYQKKTRDMFWRMAEAPPRTASLDG